MTARNTLDALRRRLHNTIDKQLGPSQVDPVLAQLMHGDDVGNAPIMKAHKAYVKFLKGHWHEIYPNLSETRGGPR